MVSINETQIYIYIQNGKAVPPQNQNIKRSMGGVDPCHFLDEKVRAMHVCMSVCLSVCPSVCMYMYVCMYLCMYVCTYESV